MLSLYIVEMQEAQSIIDSGETNLTSRQADRRGEVRKNRVIKSHPYLICAHREYCIPFSTTRLDQKQKRELNEE